jgi:hypothetical protein
MIGVTGQYLVQFSMGDQDDFIQPEDLIVFKIVEETGNILPQFELQFQTSDSKVMSQLKEGTVIKVSMGITNEEMDTTELVCLRKVMSQVESKFILQLIGVYNALPYVTDTHMSISDEMSAIEVMTSIANTYFNVDGNLTESEDSQKWIQPNVTDHNFINQLWMHAYIDGSFPIIGISMDGTFYIKDIKKSIEEGFVWTFTPYDLTEEDSITYLGNAVISAETGFTNLWSGYQRTKNVLDWNSGEMSEIESTTTPLLALTSTFDQSTKVSTRIAESGILNDNVDTNYHKAYMNNLSNLILFSSTTINIDYKNLYKPQEILDLVMFNAPDVGDKKASAIEYYSGLYIISKIVRTIRENYFSTNVTLVRESLNQLEEVT